MPYVLRHKNITPPQYIAGSLDKNSIMGWVTNDYARATVFPTMDDAIFARRETGDFAPLFEIVPKLEVL